MKNRIISFVLVVVVILIISCAFFYFFNTFHNSPKSQIQKENISYNESVEAVGGEIFKPSQYYNVDRVIDGDTFVVDIEGKKETVRVLGINAPETVDSRKPVECFGKEASLEAKNILENKKVRLETDPSQSVFDKYGRLLAYVFVSDGIFFDEYMVEKGFAFEYTFKGMSYKYQKDLKEKERLARMNNVGLWAKDACGGKLKFQIKN